MEETSPLTATGLGLGERKQEVWWQIRTQELRMRTSWDTQQQHMQAQWNEINAENRDLAHRSDATDAERHQAEETAAQLAAIHTELQEETATWARQTQVASTWQESEARMRMQQAEARTPDLEANVRWREAA